MNKTQSYIRRLVKEEGIPNWTPYAISFVFMTGGATATGWFAGTVKNIVDDVFNKKDPNAIISVTLLIIFLAVVKGACSYGQQFMLNGVGNRIVANIQMKLYSRLLQHGVPYFSNAHSTQFLAQQSFISNSARSALDLLINSIGKDTLTLLALTAVMIYSDPILSIGALITMPVALFGVRNLIRRVRKIMATEFSSFSDIMRITSETAQGIRVVKAFSLETYMLDYMKRSVNSLAKAATRLNNVSNRSSPLMETLGGLAVALVVAYGGYSVVYRGQDSGSIFSFITALLMAYEPAKRLAKFNIDFNAQMVGVSMLYTFIDAPAMEEDDSSLPDLIVTKGEITFKNVSFAYRSEDQVLIDLSFNAYGSKITALIGPSGSGKSTTFGLLQRFFEPTSGTIYIDGQDISKVNRESLRRSIAPVSQDTFLFQGSILQNVGLGNLNATREEIVAACKAAHVDNFVSEFVDGYDAQVGEHGMSLSGGQRQRVAIARALLKKSPIVLLDEATSALDTTSEHYVREGLQHLCAGRTVLIIAHRKESYSHADEVIAIEAGRILQAA